MSEIAERPTLGQMSIPGVELTYTALVITDPDFSYESYAEVAKAAGRFKTASSWWLGDLVILGEKLYGERYVQAMEFSGLAYETLSNYAWVCRQIPRSRRRDHLRFSHHVQVAGFEPKEQTKWLDAAEENRWSVAELRVAIKAESGPEEEEEQPQWSGDEEPKVLSPDSVAEVAERAERSLKQPLPEGHPLWRSQAEELARDVLSLARTVEASQPEAEQVTCPNCGANFDA